jgi:hypothetical protein
MVSFGVCKKNEYTWTLLGMFLKCCNLPSWSYFLQITKHNLFSSGCGTELTVVSRMDIVADGLVAHPSHLCIKNVFKSAYLHLSDVRLLPQCKWILLFWDVVWHRLVLCYRLCQSTYQLHLWGPWTTWCLKMGLVVCPEMSVTNCQSTLCNIPEEWGL